MMKNITIKAGFLLTLFLVSGVSLFAQEGHKEESKMLVKVLKDGKALLDTTYLMGKDFDQKKMEAMIEDMEGDEKIIKIFKSGGEHSHSVDYFISSETDSVVKGELKWITKEVGTMDISENIVIEEINEGDDGKITKHYVVKSGDDSGKGEAKFVVVKKIGEECEGDELETEIELIVGDDKGMHKFHTDEGKTIIFGGENVHGKAIKHSIHKNDKGNVFFFEGDGEGNEFIFDVKKKEGNQISLDAKGNGDYRLEFVSDELEPIKVEVFDGEGNKLFKKKVKNFYGRFLKDLNLQGNDSGLFTVRVLQGEKEIIGEFEFK